LHFVAIGTATFDVRRSALLKTKAASEASPCQKELPIVQQRSRPDGIRND
jgi:hypothetical protein